MASSPSSTTLTGRDLRRLRETETISLRAVAGKLEFSPQYVSDLELGHRLLTPKLAERYAAALLELKAGA